MDIMIDTNIVISAALFPNVRMSRFLSIVSEKNSLYLCSYTLEEIERVVMRKFATKKHDMAIFLQRLRYTLIHTPNVNILGDVLVRDPNDNPILASAILADVDVLITGDRDFEPIDIERPEILTISDFMDKYANRNS